MDVKKVLIVDDDPYIREIVRDYCEQEGFVVAEASDCEEATRLIGHYEPDLIVLDILMPGDDGMTWCRSVRSSTRAVIIFLSSREEDEVKIQALSDGGDDYVTKPFSPKVLVAKIKAHLRRTSTSGVDRYLDMPGIRLDFVAQNVYINGNLVFLSKKEFGILAHMAQAADQIVDTETLFQLIWGTDSLEDTRTVAVHISNLRKKIEADPAEPQRLVTIRGVGYKFVSNPV